MISTSKQDSISLASAWANKAVYSINQALQYLDADHARGTLYDYGDDCQDRLITFATAVKTRSKEIHRSQAR